VLVRRYIGMVFQQPNPFATSVYNNVAFGLRLNAFKGDSHAKVEKALKVGGPVGRGEGQAE
jgi:phosphate transport system ATP-binding protein